MSQEQAIDKKKSAEYFADMFKVFGQAVGEIFDDPVLREKAKEFTESAAESKKPLVAGLKTRMSKLNSETWAKPLRTLVRVLRIPLKEKNRKFRHSIYPFQPHDSTR